MTGVLGGVLLASLVGSLHCVGMCGGFVAFYAGASHGPRLGGPSALPHVAYNGGRLVTYTLLGGLAGTAGATLNLSERWTGLDEVAAVVAGTLIIAWGAFLLAQATGAEWARGPAPFGIDRLLQRLLPSFMGRPPVVRAFALGLASTLLPCGWLYGFAATAAGTGSTLEGAAVMATFWMGTVPAMVFAGVSSRALARVVGPRLGWLMPLLLIVIGVATLLSRTGGAG